MGAPQRLADHFVDQPERAQTICREAHRLVEKRYVGGLATIAELLGAEATATGAALAHAAARYAVIDAVAQHRRAIGADPGAIARLDTDASSLSTSGALR